MNAIDLISGLVILVGPTSEIAPGDDRRRTPMLVCRQCHQRIMNANEGILVTMQFSHEGELVESAQAHVQLPTLLHASCLEAFRDANPASDWRENGTVLEALRSLTADFAAFDRMQKAAATKDDPAPAKSKKRRKSRPSFDA